MDWLAAVFELAGGWIVGNKNRIGFLLLFGCCVAWVLHVTLVRGSYGLLMVVIPSMLINVRNFIKWRRKE